MTGRGWDRVAALFDRALERPARERRAFLERECADDAMLRAEVQALLAAHDVSDGPVDRLASALRPHAPDEGLTAPGWVGPYRIIRELGAGGMGVVYLARRADGEYERHVALKLARGSIHDPHVRERFLAERQILASLSHPGIATFFEGGVTEGGHPYFTMEFVEGERIDRYCDSHRLSIPARLRVFLQVCGAVAAAHRSLVVHRDLKPSNVLVTADGSVRLLDFGIAKLLAPVHEGEATGGAVRFFSRDFASPEQVAGRPITTASDVYSLGAMLYLLLTGTGAHRFENDSRGAVERAIASTVPIRPSEAAPEHGRELRGDLDAIVLKALNKEPERRYESVEALADDIRRHLEHRPIAARPDTWPYRLRKFTRRNRVRVATAALLAAVLLGGTVGVLVQAQRARAAAERAQKVSRMLTELFSLAEPGRVGSGALTGRALLDRGTARIETELAGDPATQAEVYLAVGRAYANLALLDSAVRLLERSLALSEQVHGAESASVATAAEALGRAHFDRNEYQKAEALYQRALPIRRDGPAPPEQLAATLVGLGAVLSASGKHTAAVPLLREAVERGRATPGGDGVRLAQALHELALALLRGGQTDTAAPFFREAVERTRHDPRAAGPTRVASLLNLARIVYLFDRRPADAEPLYREALALAEQLFPSDHPEIATCVSEIARVVRDLDRPAEAEQLAGRALQMWQRLHGDGHRDTIISMVTLADLLRRRGALGEAEALHRSALANAQRSLGTANPITLRAQGSLADFLAETGRVKQALALRKAELATARQAFGEQDVYVARALAGLGLVLASAGNLSDAEASLSRALAIRERLHSSGHWRVAEAQLLLGAVLLQRRQFEEARALLAAASRGLSVAQREEVRTADVLLARAVERRPGKWGDVRLHVPSGGQ